MKYTNSFIKNLNLKIYFLIIILTTFFTDSQANAGNIVCGVHYEGDGEVPVVRNINIAAYVQLKKVTKKIVKKLLIHLIQPKKKKLICGLPQVSIS